LWTRVTVVGRVPYSTVVNGVASGIMLNLEPTCAFNNTEFLSGNVNAKRPAGSQYQFTFSGSGPESLSVLTPTTSGWNLTLQNSAQNLIKNSVGALWFNWGPEAPVITLQVNAMAGVPFNGVDPIVRYLPVGTEYTLRLQNGALLQYGTWNPTSSTTFKIVSRLYNGQYYIKGSGVLPDSYYNGFPQTITVDQV